MRNDAFAGAALTLVAVITGAALSFFPVQMMDDYSSHQKMAGLYQQLSDEIDTNEHICDTATGDMELEAARHGPFKNYKLESVDRMSNLAWAGAASNGDFTLQLADNDSLRHTLMATYLRVQIFNVILNDLSQYQPLIPIIGQRGAIDAHEYYKNIVGECAALRSEFKDLRVPLVEHRNAELIKAGSVAKRMTAVSVGGLILLIISIFWLFSQRRRTGATGKAKKGV